MKNLLKVASLLSAGAALSTAVAMAADNAARPFILTAGLKGFYDDNIFTGNDKVDIDNADGDNDLSTGVDKREFDSFGFEFTPGVRYTLPLDNTTLALSYTYGLRYYADRPGRSTDQYHLADVNLSHVFNERYKVSMFDNFAISQEPAQMNASVASGTLPQLLRAEGSNIRNIAGVDFNAVITPQWSAVVGYRNGYYNYDELQFADFLNRMEHLPSLGLRYQLTPKTVLSGNYQLGISDYTRANVRDSVSHYGFMGVDHSFTARLVASLRAGAQFITWDNEGGGRRDDAVNPYVDGTLTYSYAEGSNVQLGLRHGRNATDLQGVLDQQSTLVYGSLNHQFTGKLRGVLSGQFQNSEFVGEFENAGADGLNEKYYAVGLTLSYRINAYLAAEASYMFDRLSSDIVLREYDRNRVFVGIRANY